MSFRFTGNWLFLPTWLALFRRISGRAAWVKEEVHFLNRALSENPGRVTVVAASLGRMRKPAGLAGGRAKQGPGKGQCGALAAVVDRGYVIL